MKKIAALLTALACTAFAPAQAQNVRQVTLTTNDIVYDAHSGKIYASAPSSGSVTPIDPATGAVGVPVPVGSEPNKLAVSGDGQFLYVSVDGGASVRRVTLATQTADLQFSLGLNSQGGPYYVEDMQVLPGGAHTLAVSEKSPPTSGNAGIALFDDGVQRGPRLTSWANDFGLLAFSSDPSRLYTYDNENSGHGFYRLRVDASGLSLVGGADSLMNGAAIQSDGALVYCSSGAVLDPEVLTLRGRFSGILPGAAVWDGISVRPDPAGGRVFFLSSTSSSGQRGTATLQAYDAATFRPIGALSIPGLIGGMGGLITCGAGGLAFRTSGGQVFLIDSQNLPGLSALRLSASQVAGGGAATGTVTLTRPAPAGGVTVALSSSDRFAASVPASVSVAAGAAGATFPVTSRQIPASRSVLITAACGAQSGRARLTVRGATAAPDYPANVRVLTLDSNDLVYDRVRGRFYASSPSGAVGAGNSILTLDPMAAALAPPVLVGSEPSALALSDDATALYIGLDGAASVRRFDTAAQTAGPQFDLGRHPALGPYYVQQILPLPGSTHSIAVAEAHQNVSPSNDGVAIFDDGVQRSQRLSTVLNQYDSLTFSSDPSRLYAYDDEGDGNGYLRLNVGGSGVSSLGTVSHLYGGIYATIVCDGGLLYASTGDVVDPEAGSLIGHFPGAGPSFSLVRPDVAGGRVFFLSTSTTQSGAATIQAYDPATFQPIGTLTIPGIVGELGALTRWGADGLAFRTSGGQVFLIRTSLVPNPQPTPASVTLAPASVVSGDPSAGTVTLAVPAPSGGVTLWLSSGNPDLASVPASLTVAAGQTSAAFPVATRAAPAGATVTVSAVSGGVTASAPLTLLAPTRARILWTNPDGRATLWFVNPDNTYGVSGAYGPYVDGGGVWRAVAVATGPNGVARILWTNPDGRATLWYVNPDGSYGVSGTYGPYSDSGGAWKAGAVSVGPDNVAHILWTNPDGRATLWFINPDNTYGLVGAYGPYADKGGVWRAAAVATGPNGVSRILWNNPDGRATLWFVNSDGTFGLSGAYGPYVDGGGVWKAGAVSVGPDNVAHILWNNPDGRATFWFVNTDNSFGLVGAYGPYADGGGLWNAAALTTDPSGVSRILWANPDGRATLWFVNPSGAYGVSGAYGPYVDGGGVWRAVADAAGP